ncbi:MAG: SH3 domain-containing protein [Alphaproteobacteria bacterium]
MERVFLALTVLCLAAWTGPSLATDIKTPTVKAPAAPKAPVKPVVAAKPVTTAKSVEPKAPADNVNAGPQLPVPRFVTLSVDEVNVRTGPALKYPIKFIIRRDGLPVEIMREFDVWRQIRDKDGDNGWVHKSMLSGKRAVIIKDVVQPVLKKPEDSARPVVKLEPDVIAALQKCKGGWCAVKVQSYEGWIKRSGIWGVYPDEKFQE